MKKALIIILISCCLAVTTALTRPLSGPADAELRRVQLAISRFSMSTEQLDDAVNHIDSGHLQTIIHARQALRNCRLQYKSIEYFLEYFFHSSALIYNNPAKFEVEEPFMEFEAPRGLQQIEALLFSGNFFAEKKALQQETMALRESAPDLGALLYDFRMDDAQLLESLRIELIRVITLGITGYDAPKLKSGIAESLQALRSMSTSLQPFLNNAPKERDSINYYLKESIERLETDSDFDRFNRLDFLTRAALPLQTHLGLLITELNKELNTVPGLDYTSGNIFSKNAIHIPVTNIPETVNQNLVSLGKKLFFEKALSGNFSRSCASCHRPADYFTDGLPKSNAFDNRSTVKRNAPSLLYAGYQHRQFWDGRAGTLEEQVRIVLKNPMEMNIGLSTVTSRLQKSKSYRALFENTFANDHNQPITISEVAIAISSFIRSLAPMHAPFDLYLAGDQKTMTEDQKTGFNLFMGKAQCGTCHFPPFFNGLRPPLYAVTEFEVLGVPRDDDFTRIRKDNDPGRFAVIPVSYYRQAFKTPSLRNCAVTAPYMHNGSFRSLENVMEFYNKGGGNGLGLYTADQTLSAEQLGLSPLEIKQVVAFLHALTDPLPNERQLSIH